MTSLEPFSASSRARWTTSPTLASAVSVVCSQAMPSLVLRWYWLMRSSSPRSCIARLVPKGSSEGRLISLPDDSLRCVFESLFEMPLRSLSSARLSIDWVMRVPAIA